MAVVAAANQPADTPTVVTIPGLAAQALRAIGINQLSQSDQSIAITSTHTADEIASLALQQLGVNQAGTAVATDGTTFAVADIGALALVLLNIYASQETPSATDTTLATSWATSFQNECVAMGIATWSDSAIPVQVANLYTIGTAAMMAPAFEKPADPQGFAGAIAGIKAMANAGLNAQAFAVDHVGQVHQMLVGKNLANWAITAIPDPVVEYYGELVAQEMAAAFGQQFNPAAYNGAMSGMRRYLLSGAFGQALAEAKVTQVHEGLLARSMISWADDAIPAAVADSYVQMAAYLLEPMLERAPDQPQLYTQMTSDAASARVSIFATVSGSQVLAEQVLRGVHAEWRARSMTRWEIFSIPRELEEAYVCATAYRLGPQFPRNLFPGMQFDAKWEQWAEQTIFRMIALRPTGERVVAEYF